MTARSHTRLYKNAKARARRRKLERERRFRQGIARPRIVSQSDEQLSESAWRVLAKGARQDARRHG